MIWRVFSWCYNAGERSKSSALQRFSLVFSSRHSLSHMIVHRTTASVAFDIFTRIIWRKKLRLERRRRRTRKERMRVINNPFLWSIVYVVSAEKLVGVERIRIIMLNNCHQKRVAMSACQKVPRPIETNSSLSRADGRKKKKENLIRVTVFFFFYCSSCRAWLKRCQTTTKDAELRTVRRWNWLENCLSSLDVLQIRNCPRPDTAFVVWHELRHHIEWTEAIHPLAVLRCWWLGAAMSVSWKESVHVSSFHSSLRATEEMHANSRWTRALNVTCTRRVESIRRKYVLSTHLLRWRTRIIECRGRCWWEYW